MIGNEVHYDFETQLAKGEKAESVLDSFFRQWWESLPVDLDVQRRGIDRTFCSSMNGTFTVEYKADWTASRTGNVFIETVSNDATGKLGWAYTSEADRLAYFLPVDNVVCCWRFDTLREFLPVWEGRCESRAVRNDGYHTHGLLVPLVEFKRHAESVDQVQDVT